MIYYQKQTPNSITDGKKGQNPPAWFIPGGTECTKLPHLQQTKCVLHNGQRKEGKGRSRGGFLSRKQTDLEGPPYSIIGCGGVISPTSLKSLGETGLKLIPLNCLPNFRLASHMPEIVQRSVLAMSKEGSTVKMIKLHTGVL